MEKAFSHVEENSNIYNALLTLSTIALINYVNTQEFTYASRATLETVMIACASLSLLSTSISTIQDGVKKVIFSELRPRERNMYSTKLLQNYFCSSLIMISHIALNSGVDVSFFH